MSPTVSVIIPAFNAAPYLAEAVGSALAQTLRALEVIVVDDKSTDETLALARAFDDPRVRVLANETNRGPSFSRNRALRAARGTWVAILDADDWYAPDRLERLLAVAETAGADMVADDQFLIQDGEAAPHTTQFATAGAPLRRPLTVDPVAFVRSNRPGFRSLRLGATKVLTRRGFLEEHGLGYDEGVWFCEDFRFYLECLLRGARFVVVPEAYYYRRQHAASITAGDKVALHAHDVEASAALLRLPHIRACEPVAAALVQRLAEARSHLAYRRLERAYRVGGVGAALRQFRREPGGLLFLLRRLAARGGA